MKQNQESLASNEAEEPSQADHITLEKLEVMRLEAIDMLCELKRFYIQHIISQDGTAPAIEETLTFFEDPLFRGSVDEMTNADALMEIRDTAIAHMAICKEQYAKQHPAHTISRVRYILGQNPEPQTPIDETDFGKVMQRLKSIRSATWRRVYQLGD